MKHLLLIAVTTISSFLSFNTFAQSDYTVSWGASGLSGSGLVSLKYDLDVGSSFYAIHGAYTLNNGLSIPSTGTCFSTNAGGVLCNITMNAFNGALNIGQNLNGTITIFDQNGQQIEAGVLTMKSLN
tara:strand:- start:4917 stop:5297 length:381 start_codon:yes stop_codon:yes gene_type:complete